MERAQVVTEASSPYGETRGVNLSQTRLHEEHIETVAKALEEAFRNTSRHVVKSDGRRIRQLKKELLRKDRALPEAAALIVL